MISARLLHLIKNKLFLEPGWLMWCMCEHLKQFVFEMAHDVVRQGFLKWPAMLFYFLPEYSCITAHRWVRGEMFSRAFHLSRLAQLYLLERRCIIICATLYTSASEWGRSPRYPLRFSKKGERGFPQRRSGDGKSALLENKDVILTLLA